MMSVPAESERVLVLDFGGQYAQLIARRVRECRVYSELIPFDTPVDEIRRLRPSGLILSGGPSSVNNPDAPQLDPEILNLSVPVLGICYGLQMIAKIRGGRVGRTDRAEYGGIDLNVVGNSRVLEGVPQRFSGWMSHGDSVLETPPGFEVVARRPEIPIAAMEDRESGHYGVQFHPEVRHTDHGQEMLKNFLFRVCDLAPTWTPVSIVEEFIRTFEEEAAGLGEVSYLVQGTLYSDVIESGTRDAARIKSHHNVGGLPEQMDFELVEPLRMLFKDEVRVVGEELGLPEEMVWRQPFPGPGLAIRIIGDITEERLRILRHSDAILLEEVRKAGYYQKLWQSFAVLPAIRSVGVMGDERTYAYPVVIRAVTSDDAMTADWARLPYPLLERMSSRIINEVPGVNRVALDISSKPPATIEWE